MEFNKYKELGDYHWSEYKAKTIYGQHADKVAQWVGDGKNLLDIGAGDGLITSLLPGAIGIDDNEVAVSLAKEHGVNVYLMDAYHLSQFDITMFDKVLMADVIEHFEFPEKILESVYNLLKPEGLLFITTPPKKDNGELHDKYHYKEYSPEELKEFVEKFGFKLISQIEQKFVRIYAKFQKV
jgi:2-polyprenyl-3-methyl-5-hydroxy-6-metoxy-1,4-benzoquinol methylase